MSTPHPLDDPDATDAPADDPRADWRYQNSNDWFAGWFRPAMAGHFSSSHRWCAQWWQHLPVALRIEELWTAWEAARLSEDPSAMSGWRVHHADPQWRAITAEDGPLHQCTPTSHTHTRPLAAIPAPPGWSDLL